MENPTSFSFTTNSDSEQSLAHAIDALFEQQVAHWDLAKQNYEALKTAKSKTLNVLGFPLQVQFNPSRIVSSAAKVDPKSIQQRPCLLCETNRPAEQQGILVDHRYWILVNPFPIFPKHLTISSVEHIDQHIAGNFGDMLLLAKALPEFVLFYNGPQCGASAPDHLHFQAGNKGFLPLEFHWNTWKNYTEPIVEELNFTLCRHITYPHALLAMESGDSERLIEWFEKIYSLLDNKRTNIEPMINLVCTWQKDKWIVWLFPREIHRPACYFAEDETQLLISPASVDLSGVFITPREEDFQKVTATDIATILDEISTPCEQLDILCQTLKNS